MFYKHKKQFQYSKNASLLSILFSHFRGSLSISDPEMPGNLESMKTWKTYFTSSSKLSVSTDKKEIQILQEVVVGEGKTRSGSCHIWTFKQISKQYISKWLILRSDTAYDGQCRVCNIGQRLQITHGKEKQLLASLKSS